MRAATLEFLRAVRGRDAGALAVASLMRDPAYRQLRLAIEAGIGEFVDTAGGAIDEYVRAGATLSATSSAALVETAAGPLAAGVGRISPAVVQQIVANTQMGSPLRDLKKLTQEVNSKVMRELVRGVSRGRHPHSIARSIVKVTDVPVARARTIARTETMRAYRDVTLRTFRQNRAVSGWIWQASPGACAACMAMSGTFHTLDEGMGSHPNCRCAMLPKIVDPQTLGLDEGDIPELEVEKGEEAFKRLGPAAQDRIAGEAKGRAYRAGRIELRDMVKVTRTRQWGETRTVASMREATKNARRRSSNRPPLQPHQIRRSDVAAFLRGSHFPKPLFHATSQTNAKRVIDEGPQPSRTQTGHFGNALYLSPAHLAQYGEHAVEVALHTARVMEFASPAAVRDYLKGQGVKYGPGSPKLRQGVSDHFLHRGVDAIVVREANRRGETFIAAYDLRMARVVVDD